ATAAAAPLASRKNLRRVSCVAEIMVVPSASSYIPGSRSSLASALYARGGGFPAGFLGVGPERVVFFCLGCIHAKTPHLRCADGSMRSAAATGDREGFLSRRGD